MKTTWIFKAKRYLLRFLQVQLFITAVSLPILISWGLPISIMSPIGNLLFFPVLVLFLLLSSIIFFTELFFVPNGLFVWGLEKLAVAWTTVMSFGSSSGWLIGFKTPPTAVLVIIPVLAFLIIKNKKTGSVGRSIIFLMLLLTCSFVYLKLINKAETFIEQIECNNGQVTIIHKNGTTAVIDPGVIGRRISAPSWIEYNFAQHFIKTAGTNKIDHLIVLQPNIVTFNAIEKFCKVMQVGTLYLPYWDGTLNKNAWRSFFFAKRAAERQGTKIVRIGKRNTQIKLCDEAHFSIEPLEAEISYQEATFPALRVEGRVDNETFTIYSSKYKSIK